MLKQLFTAIISAFLGVIITKHFADKTVIELHRDYKRKEHDTWSYAFSAGWDGGYEIGYRRGHMHGTIGHNEN